MTTESFIPGKDASLESTIATMRQKLAARGFVLDESSLLHEVDGIWSTHMKDHECPMLFSNGKGATELAARASAYGEFFERLNTHYFWTHFYLGETRARRPFVHYPPRNAGSGPLMTAPGLRKCSIRNCMPYTIRRATSMPLCWST